MDNSNLIKLTDDQINQLKPKDLFILNKHPYTFSGRMNRCSNPGYKLMEVLNNDISGKGTCVAVDIEDNEVVILTIGELLCDAYQADNVSLEQRNEFAKLIYRDDIDECRRLTRIRDEHVDDINRTDGRIFAVLVDILRKCQTVGIDVPSDEIKEVFNESKYHHTIPIISSSFNIDEFISSNEGRFV